MPNVRATAKGFEAGEGADVCVYARTDKDALRLLEIELQAKRPKTRKATGLMLGKEAQPPSAPKGRKALVCLPIDAKRAVLVTEAVKPSKRRSGKNDWEFHGYRGHIVDAQAAGVRHGDGWCALVLGKTFDDIDPELLRAMPAAKRKAAYRQGYASKLAGYPYFPQRRLAAACFECGQPLEPFAQLGDSAADFMADWLLYMFLCPRRCEARIAAQS
jgi:hypothetical protein